MEGSMSSPVRVIAAMRVYVAVVCAVVSLVFALSASVAAASSLTGEYFAKPGWMVESRSYPTELQPGQEGVLVVEVYNIGAGQTSGKAQLTDTLPAGLGATGGPGAMGTGGVISKEVIEAYEEEDEEAEKALPGDSSVINQARVWQCSGMTVVSCETAPGVGGVERPIKSGYVGRIGIPVKVTGSPGTVVNRVTLSGGGAASAAESNDPLTIGSGTPGF